MIAFARLIRTLAVSALLLVLIAAGAARAQGWPAPSGHPVDDLAGVIPAGVATGLGARLAALRAETGIEIAVVTLPTREGLPAAPTLADFARDLFNARGIGTAARNDGILILLVIDERALQITLGRGYHSGYDVIAQDIVSRRMLPDLRAGEVAAALTAGVDQTITRIARRHAAGLAPEAPQPPPATGRGIWPALALIGIATLAFLRRRRRRQDDEAAAAGGQRDEGRHVEGRRDDGPRNERPQGGKNGRPPRDDNGSGGRSAGGGAAGGQSSGGQSSGGGAGGRW